MTKTLQDISKAVQCLSLSPSFTQSFFKVIFVLVFVFVLVFSFLFVLVYALVYSSVVLCLLMTLTKDTRNCQEKVNKISHLKPNQLAPSIYIMKELCLFSLDQWEISIQLYIWFEGNVSIFLIGQEVSRPMWDSKTLKSFLNPKQE